ncbi:mitochondrial rho GTPase 1-like protein [Trifolium pratense]|uniref:Mitochondrial rho GTPase 1-like protein n=1 Tax=Trifolium pratense TaxID=57577 RepID=A0A2K3L5L4_TRIPR|nr:mitochondrial rho GTPase 1-like protein [Trifolium pratense]
MILESYSDTYNPTDEDHYAVNAIDDISRENKKFLVLKEISKDGVTKLLANKESLASCDVAVFVHNRSDVSSWKESYKLLVKIARHGEDTGFEVSRAMGVEAPIPISVKLGDLNSAFRRIVTVAVHPHLCVPETEAGKTRKQQHYDMLIDRAIQFVTVCAAVVVGVAAARNLSRKNDKCFVNRS